MTTDTKATYYDIEINGATVETKDIVRAVLERAGLGADASHQLGKVLERAIRLGAKPGTDVAREVEKIAIEAGMLRDAVSPGEHRGLTADDAREWRGLRARIAELERELDEAQADHARAQVHINELCLEPTRLRSQAAQAERERDKWEERARAAERERDSLQDTLTGWYDRALDAERERDEARNLARRFQSAMDEEITRAEELERLRAELAGVVDPEQLQRWRTALSASPTETLTNAICRVTSELAALREYCRPRRQSEEPAPQPALVWNGKAWEVVRYRHLEDHEIWTHQPPAPGEGE